MQLDRSLLLVAGLPILSPALGVAQNAVEKNVVIGFYSGLALVMDVHRPEHPNGFGIVHIAGSGWGSPLAYDAQPLSERHVDLYGEPLVENGYTVFSLNHRAAPRFRYPAQLEDVQRAVRFIRFHATDYGIDPDRIGAVGGSSGGHLASLLAVLDGDGNPGDPDPVNRVSAKVQAVVVRAAPVDLTRLASARTRLASVGLALLLGARHVPQGVGGSSRDSQSEEGRRYWEASPINFASADDPPMLMLHGDADQWVPVEQSELMRDTLEAVGVESSLMLIPGANHGAEFPGAQNPPDYIAAMIEWFDRHVRR